MALPEPDIVADWMVAHPSIARGRLLTASVHMASATHNLDRIIGYLDGGKPEAPYLGLGMKEVRSQLVKAVRALDMVEPIAEVPQSPWRTEDDLPGHTNKHGAYICGPCTVGQHLGVNHAGTRHALCQCTCDGMHDHEGQLKKKRK